MDKLNRKPNRLKYYDYEQVGCYFVTICVQNRNQLFEIEPSKAQNGQFTVSTKQNQIIHKWISETENKFSGISIDKYVIMPDHLHMIVTIKERSEDCSLPSIIHFFKTMTTNDYIKGVRNGVFSAFYKKLWQKSYYDHIIRSQKDYNDAWYYIEDNPRKWIESHK